MSTCCAKHAPMNTRHINCETGRDPSAQHASEGITPSISRKTSNRRSVRSFITETSLFLEHFDDTEDHSSDATAKEYEIDDMLADFLEHEDGRAILTVKRSIEHSIEADARRQRYIRRTMYMVASARYSTPPVSRLLRPKETPWLRLLSTTRPFPKPT